MEQGIAPLGTSLRGIAQGTLAAQKDRDWMVKNKFPADRVYHFSFEYMILHFSWNTQGEHCQKLKEKSARKALKLNYTVSADGELTIGQIQDKYCGHIDLARGGQVLSAGEVSFLQGEVKWVNNQSGHYINCGEGSFEAARAAFKTWLGVDIMGRYFLSQSAGRNEPWIPLPPTHPLQKYASGLTKLGPNPKRVDRDAPQYKIKYGGEVRAAGPPIADE